MSTTTNFTYVARRMANGAKTHLCHSAGSSVTMCGAWSGNTRQYETPDKVITCTKCIKCLDSEARAQGFTAPNDLPVSAPVARKVGIITRGAHKGAVVKADEESMDCPRFMAVDGRTITIVYIVENGEPGLILAVTEDDINWIG